MPVMCVPGNGAARMPQAPGSGPSRAIPLFPNDVRASRSATSERRRFQGSASSLSARLKPNLAISCTVPPPPRPHFPRPHGFLALTPLLQPWGRMSSAARWRRGGGRCEPGCGRCWTIPAPAPRCVAGAGAACGAAGVTRPPPPGSSNRHCGHDLDRGLRRLLLPGDPARLSRGVRDHVVRHRGGVHRGVHRGIPGPPPDLPAAVVLRQGSAAHPPPLRYAWTLRQLIPSPSPLQPR